MITNELRLLLVDLADVASRTNEDQPCSLPPKLYRSPEYFELEKERFLKKEWYCFGRATDFTNSGDYLATDLVGEPLLIWASDAGEIRAFSNVCRHRSAILAPEGMGNKGVITCPYHAWTYNRNGTLRAAPSIPKNFDLSQICLTEFPVEVWQGFVFVTLDQEAEPLSPRLQELEALIDDTRMDQHTWSARCVDSTRRANWKIVVEGGMDNYHASHVHKAAYESLPPTYLERADSTNTFHSGENWSVSLSMPGPRLDDDLEGSHDENRINSYSFVVFPSLRVSLDCHDNMVWFGSYPRASDETRHVVGVAARTRDKLQLFGTSKQIELDWLKGWLAERYTEDTVVQEAVQRGAGSDYATSGPIIPELDGATVDFYRWLHRRLSV